MSAASRPRLAIVGATGFVGSRLHHYLEQQDEVDLFPLTHKEVDICDIQSLHKAFKSIKPQWIINAAGFLNPDRCEKDPMTSHAVNYQGVVNLAEAAGEHAAILFHFSTDYVFDGQKGDYSEEDATAPLSHYGKHKLMADEALLKMQAPAYILRVASLIGAGPGKMDIVKAMLDRVEGGARKLDVIDEYQISISTPQFLAHVIDSFMKEPPRFGVYHTVAEGQTSWFDVVRVAFHELEVDIPISPVPASTLQRPAPRPMKSWMKTEKLAREIGPVPLWQDVLADQIFDLRDEYLSILKKSAAA